MTTYIFFAVRLLSFVPLTILLLAQVKNMFEIGKDRLFTVRMSLLLLTLAIWIDFGLYLSGYFNLLLTGVPVQEFISLAKSLFLTTKFVMMIAVWNFYKVIYMDE